MLEDLGALYTSLMIDHPQLNKILKEKFPLTTKNGDFGRFR